MTPVNRPVDVHGCMQTWTEQDKPNTIRTEMENGIPKVRRRTTGRHRVANAQVTLEKDDVALWLDWYRVDMQQGVRSSYFIEPDGTESVWRMITAPSVRWFPGAKAALLSFQLEQLPGW